MIKQKLYIIGAGGHTRSLIASFNDKFDFIGIYDDSFQPGANELISEVAVLGVVEDAPHDNKIILSVGDNKSRANLFLLYTSPRPRD